MRPILAEVLRKELEIGTVRVCELFAPSVT
jgi:hypothetical protein